VDSGSWEAPTLERGAPPEIDLLSNWREQRRKNSRMAPVNITLRSGAVKLLSCDEAEALNIIIWSSALPPVRVLHTMLIKALPEEQMLTIVKIRQYGKKLHRRIEIICDTTSHRDILEAELRSNPIGLQNERCCRGRTSSDRKLSPQTRNISEAGSQLHAASNRYTPLVNSSNEFPFGFGILNVNGLSHLLSPLWKGVKISCPPVLLAVVETYRIHGASSMNLPGYRLIELPMRPGTKRMVKVDEDSHGVGFYVRNEWSKAIQLLNVTVKYSDCIWVRLPLDSVINKPYFSELNVRTHLPVKAVKEVWIGVYYLAPRLAEGLLRECVAEMASIAKRAGDSGAECVIMGDLNCCLRSIDDPLCTIHNISQLAMRETLLRTLLEEHGLESLHVLSPADPLYTVTK